MILRTLVLSMHVCVLVSVRRNINNLKLWEENFAELNFASHALLSKFIQIENKNCNYAASINKNSKRFVYLTLSRLNNILKVFIFFLDSSCTILYFKKRIEYKDWKTVASNISDYLVFL